MNGSGSASIRAACALSLLASGCQKRSPDAGAQGWYSKERELYFGIPVAVRFFPENDALARKVWAYLESVDDVFNDYRSDSEVGRLNAAKGRKGVRVSDDLAEALGLSIRLHEITGGAFDITVGGLVRLWKRARKSGAPPPAEAIAAERSRSGLDKVHLDGNTLTVDADGLALDFGGIVKGIAVDRVVAMLKEAGVRGALVQVGGETACFGNSKRARPHVVGVRHPLDRSRIPRVWTSITDPGTGLSVATSGNYFSPIDIGGKRFYHIFDPRTGRPVSTSVLSVSVAFPETGRNGLADGLSTACAVLGPDAALALVEKLGGEALFLVYEGGEIRERSTSGWPALVEGKMPPRREPTAPAQPAPEARNETSDASVAPPAPAKAGTLKRKLTHDKLERTYRLYVPAGLERGRAVPLVVVLHGGLGTGLRMERLTRRRFNALADRDGFLVVYPDGIDRHWNDGRVETSYRAHREKVDDVGFLSVLIDELVKEFSVDPKRVYLAGASNGAMMSIRFAVERAEKVAAVAPVMGAMPTRLAGLPRPSRPVPVMFVSGTADPLVPWEGGHVRFGVRRLGRIRSVPESVRYWVEHNGCSKEPETSMLPDTDPDDGTRVRRDVYAGGKGGSTVELWCVEGGGHTWPGGRQYLGERLIGKTCRDVDACELIWEFFKRHSR